MHQFVPVDVPRYVRRFLDHWQPTSPSWRNRRIWPNTVMALDQRHIPLVLVNGRMSDRLVPALAEAAAHHRLLLERFALCLAQTSEDAGARARRAARSGVRQPQVRFRAAARRSAGGRALSGLLAGRPVWLAYFHPGEETAIVAVHRALTQHHPHLLTIIATAPGRGGRGHRRAGGPSRRTPLARNASRPGDRRHVADTVGEVGLFYRLANIVLMGGTLVPIGGHNPIEPAKLGAAILHGPHVHSATEIYAAIDQARGALMVKDSATLARAVSQLLAQRP